MSDATQIDPPYIFRRITALGLDLVLTGILAVVLIAATPLFRLVSLPTNPSLLGPAACIPIEDVDLSGNVDTQLFLDVMTQLSALPDTGFRAVLICRSRVLGFIPYAYVEQHVDASNQLFNIRLRFVTPLDSSGNLARTLHGFEPFLVWLLLFLALVFSPGFGKRIVGL